MWCGQLLAMPPIALDTKEGERRDPTAEVSRMKACAARCCFVSDARLSRNGSLVWDALQNFPKGHWDECLEVFGRVHLVARTQSTQEFPNGSPLVPEGVEVGEFPYYVGPLAAAWKCVAVLKAARYWARQNDLFVLRIPGFVPSLVWFFLRRYRKPFAVEVIADAEQ